LKDIINLANKITGNNDVQIEDEPVVEKPVPVAKPEAAPVVTNVAAT
jgi:hypothetical protein